MARAAQTLLTEAVIDQYREGAAQIEVVLRQPYDGRDTLTRLADANVPTASGRYVPLSQLVGVEFGWGPGVMRRENRSYAITVQGDVAGGLQAATAGDRIWNTPEMAPRAGRCGRATGR